MHLVVASTTTWYAARAGGVVAYLLVSASVLAGILLAGKKRVPGLPRFAVEDVHRFLGLLAGLFIAVHVGSVASTRWCRSRSRQLIVPFTAGYRPLATGLGVVAMELLVAVAITNRLRSRLPYRFWRRAHYATLAVWLLATVHGILSGSDRSQTWLLVLYGVDRRARRRCPGASFRSALCRPAEARRSGSPSAAAPWSLVLGLSALPQQASSSKSRHGGRGRRARARRQPDRARSSRTTARASSRSAAPPRPASAFRIDLLTGGDQVADSALQLRFASGTTCEGTLTALDDTRLHRHVLAAGRRAPARCTPTGRSRTAPSPGRSRRRGGDLPRRPTPSRF